VRVPHESVGAQHARLSAGDAGDLLIEALGDAVVGCGGQRVRRGVLHDGDELILGRLRFTVVDTGAEGASRPAAQDVARAAAPPTSRPAAPTPARPPARPPAGPPARPAAHRATQTVDSAGGGEELLVPRGGRSLPTRRGGPARRGLLHADFSQYTLTMRCAMVGALLLVCAALVYAISLAFGLLG
jgi:hypothetical protein